MALAGLPYKPHSQRKTSPLLALMGSGHHCPGWTQERSQNSNGSSEVPASHSQPPVSCCPEQLGPMTVGTLSSCTEVTVQSPGLPGHPLPRDSRPHKSLHSLSWSHVFVPPLEVCPLCPLACQSPANNPISSMSSQTGPITCLRSLKLGFPSGCFSPYRRLSQPCNHWAYRRLPGSHCCFITILYPFSIMPPPPPTL